MKEVRGRPTLQKGQIPLSQASKSLIAWSEQSEISLLFQQVGQVSSIHQGQKDPAVQKQRENQTDTWLAKQLKTGILQQRHFFIRAFWIS